MLNSDNLTPGYMYQTIIPGSIQAILNSRILAWCRSKPETWAVSNEQARLTAALRLEQEPQEDRVSPSRAEPHPAQWCPTSAARKPEGMQLPSGAPQTPSKWQCCLNLVYEVIPWDESVRQHLPPHKACESVQHHGATASADTPL